MNYNKCGHSCFYMIYFSTLEKKVEKNSWRGSVDDLDLLSLKLSCCFQTCNLIMARDATQQKNSMFKEAI